MKHLAIAATAGLSLLLAATAHAAPKKDVGAAKPQAEKQVCARGIGTPVCCKTLQAGHCLYVSCCEVGNAGFFTTTECPTCVLHADEKALVAAHLPLSASAAWAAGNNAFFTGAACDKSSKAGCADGSCRSEASTAAGAKAHGHSAAKPDARK